MNVTIMYQVSNGLTLFIELHLLCQRSVSLSLLRSTLYYSGNIEVLVFTPRFSVYDSAPGWNP